MSDRLARSLDRLPHLVPDGADLAAAERVVSDDLPPRASLSELLGERIDPSLAHDAMPRIRPVLVALAARAAGARQVDGEVLHAAEILHRALQVHDAALGRQGGRRRRIARKLVKRSVGLLAGHRLTLRALELARHARPEVLDEVVDTLRQFADGQDLLVELQKGAMPTPEDWLEHADAHTGALFSFCCRAGGWLAGAERRTITALGRYGRHLGRLWHVAEDVSMLDHADAGAHLVARALAARPILAVVLAERRDPAVGRMWVGLVARPSPGAGDALAVAVRRAGGVHAAREAMLRESWAARRSLRALDDSPYRRALDRLADGIVRCQGLGRGA